MLVIEADGQSVNFPIGSGEAERIAGYLKGYPGKGPGRPKGSTDSRPRARSGRAKRTVITEEEVKEAAALYTSPEAGAYSSRLRYVADQLGMTKGQANVRIVKARSAGMLTQRYNTRGEQIA